MTKSKILAVLFTTLVITLLVLTGPVQGFNLNLSVNKTRPIQGDTLTFTAQIEVESGESLQIEKLILELSGPEEISCAFTRDGEILDGCEDITITKIQDTSYSYGYGYGYGYGYSQSGFLKYKIELNTEHVKPGKYTTLLKVKIGEEFFNQPGKDITVRDDDDDQICGPEWTCSSWSQCIDGVQHRECYRNLNYCLLEEKPSEERSYLLEDGDNFLGEESIVLNQISQDGFNAKSSTSLDFQNNGVSDSLQFIIILLLMNCIITLINIIVKVQKNRHTRMMRVRKRMPSIKKAN
ncbi:MAG: hypothetical protein ABH864_00480 [archaeon]